MCDLILKGEITGFKTMQGTDLIPYILFILKNGISVDTMATSFSELKVL